MDYIITTKMLTKKYKSFVAVDDISIHIRFILEKVVYMDFSVLMEQENQQL